MPPEVTLKVFAYNVQMLDQVFTFDYHNTERAKLIGDILARSDYDVIIFSEAFDNGARQEMIKRLQKTFPARTAVVGNDDDIGIHEVVGAGFLTGGIAGGAVLGPLGALGGALLGALVGGLFTWFSGTPKSDGGIFIVSRWPIQLQGQIIYKKSASEDRLGRKGVSWALINKEGFYFNVFGTHTQADKQYASIRGTQFDQIRVMYEALAPNWHPALIGGDLNVDFCFERDRCPANPPDDDGDDDGDDGGGPDRPGGGGGPIRPLPRMARDLSEVTRAGGQALATAGGCCTPNERDEMLRRLGAALPGDLSKYTYSRDRSNDLKNPGGEGPGLGSTLDYVLHVNEPRQKPLRPQPRRASLATVRLRGVVKGRERDLSDHFGVLGTYTYPFVREDSNNFTGTWRCVKFNNQPDTHGHRLTFAPFGKQVLDVFDGKKRYTYIHQLYPGKENTGRIIFRVLPAGNFVEYEYTFNSNEDFLQYFIPSEIELPRRRRTRQTRPRPKNELFLRNAQRSMLYAFESWPPVEVQDDFRPGGPV